MPEPIRPKKLTKAQRRKLVDPKTRAWVERLDDETVLAVHDLTHEVMNERGYREAAAMREAIAAKPTTPRQAETAAIPEER